MGRGLSTGLLIVGLILIVLGLVEHFVLKIPVAVPHFSVILGAIGLIVATIGAWGLTGSQRA
jgi:hypothetical protein